MKVAEEPELCLRFPRTQQQLMTPCINAASFTRRKALLCHIAHSDTLGSCQLTSVVHCFLGLGVLIGDPTCVTPTELCRSLSLGFLAAHVWVVWP